jgi:hypothetical protein
MPSIGYWVMLMHRARQHLTASPHILPAHVIEAVKAMGGVCSYISAIVLDGDPVQVDFMKATILVCLHLCDLGLGWVPYVLDAAAAELLKVGLFKFCLNC